jgi:hypothetical protein
MMFPATDRTAPVKAHSLEPLLKVCERQGAADMPYPPDYPKMPGEPKRVQPSRAGGRDQRCARRGSGGVRTNGSSTYGAAFGRATRRVPGS